MSRLAACFLCTLFIVPAAQSGLVNASISPETPAVLHLAFDAPAGLRPGATGPAPVVLWRHFDGRSAREDALPVAGVEWRAGDREANVTLAQPAPTIGIVIVTHGPRRVVARNLSGLVSRWEDGERTWAGREFWTNRLQDWRVRAGRLECLQAGPRREVRTAHLVTHEVSRNAGEFHLSVRTGVLEAGNGNGWSGFLIGAGAGQLEYRAAALVHHHSGQGGGLQAVWNMEGRLQFRDNGVEEPRDAYPEISAEAASADSALSKRGLWEDAQLDLDAVPVSGGKYDLRLALWDSSTGEFLGGAVARGRDEREVLGSLALVSSPAGQGRGPRFWFRDLRASGSKLAHHPDRGFGPVAAALFTVSKGVLKMTAQMMPVGIRDPRIVRLEYRTQGGDWVRGPESPVVTPGFTAHLRVAPWTATAEHEYRLVYGNLPVWNGRIPKDPRDRGDLVIAGFTGQQVIARPADDSWGRAGYGRPSGRWTTDNVWFPHVQTVRNVRQHRPDILLFTGDQIYEGGNPTARDDDGRFPELDYLYKWYLWCWSFGQLARDLPATVQPDDHDVYQGNIWGWGGRRNLTGDNQDGGYMFEPEFVNMVERTQTAHLPDPFDPTPAERGITVYYTDLLWGGVSFAVLEDRKFKAGPRAVKRGMEPGFVDDGKIFHPGYDFREMTPPELDLLGARQEQFLRHWAGDWAGAWAKVAVTQTILASVQTNAAGRMVPDLDANGWPPLPRDRAVDLLRRARAIGIAGDTHLSFVVRHGIQRHGDGIYQFCVPAAANKYRRWFDPAAPGANRKPDSPTYTGDFLDSFGNRITLLAVANSRVTPREILESREKQTPESLARRDDYHGVLARKINADGYGIVRLDRRRQTARIESWPWDADPAAGDGGMFPGWPITVPFDELDGRKPVAWLPDLHFTGKTDPVVQVLDEASGELVYSARARDGYFRPGVFADGVYTIRAGEPIMEGRAVLRSDAPAGMKVFRGLRPSPKPGARLNIKLD